MYVMLYFIIPYLSYVLYYIVYTVLRTVSLFWDNHINLKKLSIILIVTGRNSSFLFLDLVFYRVAICSKYKRVELTAKVLVCFLLKADGHEIELKV